MNTGPEDRGEAIRNFLREGMEEDRVAEWNVTSREYPKISNIDAELTTIVGVVQHADWAYRDDGRPFCAIELTDGTTATDPCDDVETIVDRHAESDGYRVRLTGRWADVELLHPEHPYGRGWPSPGRWFVIEGFERQERAEYRGGAHGVLHVTSEEPVTIEGWILRRLEERETLDNDRIVKSFQFELVTWGRSGVQEYLPCVAPTAVGEELHEYYSRNDASPGEGWRWDERWVRLTGRQGRLIDEGQGTDADYPAFIADSWEPLQEPPVPQHTWL